MVVFINKRIIKIFKKQLVINLYINGENIIELLAFRILASIINYNAIKLAKLTAEK